ncbi:MAG: NUDIX domain-containing protein [Cellulophaga sp.]
MEVLVALQYKRKRFKMAKFTSGMFDFMRKDLAKSISQLSINCVIFRFYKQVLQIPVVGVLNNDIWYIPGGFIGQDEGIDEAAKRILQEQTELENLPLYQFGTFGPVHREFGSEFSSIQGFNIPKDLLDWISKRFITIGYYSVIGPEEINLNTNLFFKDVKWINVEDANILGLDHSLLVSEARKTLGAELLRKPLLLSFMPETFTIPELQKLYEAILGRSIDRGNFRQRILKSKSIIKIGATQEKTKRRPADLYKFDKEMYFKSLTQDVKFGF